MNYQPTKDELAQLDPVQLACMQERLDWLDSARPKQLPPQSYFCWMLLAGRGSGKTRAGAEDIWWPASRQQERVAVIGPTLADVRKTCFEGESGLLACAPRELIHSYNRSLCELWFTNGSYFVGYSSEEPERLRGPQHHRAWCDELAAWRYIDDTWDMMMFGLRLGQSPSVIVTTTPKPVGLVRRLIREPDTVVSRESTYANERNLPPKIVAKLRSKYEGTRLGRQELHAEILEDNPYALWNQTLLDKHRIKQVPPRLERVVVSLDPPVTSGESADECGIVCAGRYRGEDGRTHVVVMDDWSVGQRTPHGWASRGVSLWKNRRANIIVAEVNNGGDLIETVIHTVDPRIPVLKVRASRGKVTRAEPVAMLYEQGRVHHLGHLPGLEDQMCDFTTDFDKDVMGYSPDRVDALVWAIWALMIEGDLDYGMLGAM